MSEEEVKLFKFSFEEGKFKFSLDTDKDGEPLLKGVISLDEAIQEALKKGEAVEGEKVVDFDTSLGGLKVLADTNKDGEPSVELEILFAEALSEVL